MSERSDAVAPERALGSRVFDLAAAYFATVAIAVVVFVVAYDNGGTGESGRDVFAIVLWWILLLGIGLGIWPLRRIPRIALVSGGLLTAFGLLTLASTGWAADAARAYAEFTRVALYVGVFALVVVCSGRRSAARWSDGLALGIGAVVVVALLSRFFPGLFPSSTQEIARFLQGAETRLSFPIGYWNGLAIFAALGIPLFLRHAVAARTLALRGLAVAPIPAVAGVVYLASSRGGVIVAAVGTVAFFALVPERWATAGAVVAAGAASAVVVFVLHQRGTLVNGPLGTSTAKSQGLTAALLVAAICLIAAAVYAVGSDLASRLRRPGPRVGQALLGLVILAVIGAAIASHPIRRLHDFTRQPTESFGIQQHLLSGSGTGRWQFWQAAWGEFESRPFQGRGAGSYEAWWAQHGSIPVFIQDAHSLYLQTLGELGIVGFLLLVAALGSGLVAGILRWRSVEGGRRRTLAALVATFVAWAVAAGIDWMWQVTVVTVVAVVCLGLMAGPATTFDEQPRAVAEDERPRRRRFGRFGAVVAAIVAGWLVICAVAIQLLAGVKIRDSQAAIGRGDTKAAIDDALSAKSIQPWSSQPYLQVALVAEDAGDLQTAGTWIGRAIAHDREDWRLWLVQARIQTKLGLNQAARASLDRARELNPHSSLFQTG